MHDFGKPSIILRSNSINFGINVLSIRGIHSTSTIPTAEVHFSGIYVLSSLISQFTLIRG